MAADMTDMMECFNDPKLGSKDQAEVGEFANVTGLVLGRNDSFHNVEMGFKDPDNPESPSKGPSLAPSRNVSVSQDAQEHDSAKYLNEVKASLVEDEPSPISPKEAAAAAPEPSDPKPATPKKLSSYDFSYSADSHDSPPKEKTLGDDPKYRRQVSSPIMDHLIETMSDENDTAPKRENPSHEEDLNQFMESIPSKFDKPKPDPFEKPKISPRVSEKIEERRKSSAQPINPVDKPLSHDNSAAGEPPNRQSSNRPVPHRDNHGEVDEQDMAVIMANREKKKKKKPNDSYMGEFEVVAAGKKPSHAASKDYDELDMKNRPRKKKNNDSYLSEIPVVHASKQSADKPEIAAGRRPSKPMEPMPTDQAERKNRNGDMGARRGRSQKPAANDHYLAEIPVVRVKKAPEERELGGKEGRSSYEEIEFKRKMKERTPVANRQNRTGNSNNSVSPERGYKPQPPSSKKPSGGGRKLDPVPMLPRLVQSDQTDSRNKKMRNDVGSRDDSNDFGEPIKPRRKKKKPLFMRLQEKALRQEGEREREKMAAYALLKEKKKMGQPSHQELLEHRQKYAELKHQEELRKQEAREFRENEWRKMQKMLEEKNEAVVSHVPHSVSPLKRRNSSNCGGSDDDSTATPYSQVSQKKKKKRRSKVPSETDDDDSVSSAAVHRHNDVYLPNIVSPAKLSPRGIGKVRRAKRREGDSDENRAPRYNSKNLREGAEDMSHDEEDSNHRNGAGKQVRMSIPDEVRPEPIRTEKHTEESEGHVRFAEGEDPSYIAITRKSQDADNSGGKSSDMNTGNMMNLRGPQYLAELLEADQHEEDLAKMYETGFEMQMVERGMMETPSAAKAAAGAHKRVPV